MRCSGHPDERAAAARTITLTSILSILPPDSTGARCCWSRWGNNSTCGAYPSAASGGRCSTDWSTKCSSPADCPSTPTPSPPPTPPSPSPSPTPGPTPGPTPAGNVSGIPGPDASMTAFYNDTSTRSNATRIATCRAYQGGTSIPWRTIAVDWGTGGGRMADCAAALIIASGETSCTAAGCMSVQAGIWQVTSPDLPGPSGCPDGSTNPCCTVDYVRNHFTTRGAAGGAKKEKTTSGNIGCMGAFNGGNGWSGDPKVKGFMY